MGIKIGFIGAGSACFSLAVIRDICLTPGLRGAEVVLMDVDPWRLDVAHRLCTRYAAELGSRLRIGKTTSRAACLKGADFVIHTALARGGNHDRLQEGWKIARAHGYRLAGSMHVMHDEAFWVNFHQLELMDSIARDMLRICPKAWLLLVANPVFAGTTWLMRRYPRLRMTGLCHGYTGVFGIPHDLGMKGPGKVDFEVAGVNHFIWVTRLTKGGRDVFPRLDRWITRGGPRRFWSRWRGGAVIDTALSPIRVDTYRMLGAIPVGDAGHTAGGGWPYWYRAGRATERRWRENAANWWAGHFRYCRREIRDIERLVRNPKLSLAKQYGTTHSGESMIGIVESIARDIPRRFVVNTLNTGEWVPGIPRDIAVEFRGRVDGRGIHGVRTRRLPEGVLAWITRDLVAPVNMELAAYEEGSRALLLNLILMDPFSRTKEQAARFMNAILARHPAMARHYR